MILEFYGDVLPNFGNVTHFFYWPVNTSLFLLLLTSTTFEPFQTFLTENRKTQAMNVLRLKYAKKSEGLFE